jgi:hypothetical protein
MNTGSTAYQSTTILDNEYASLLFYPDQKIIHHVFKQPIGGEHFRGVLLRGIDLLKQHGAGKWLSDDRNNSALSPEDTQWGPTVWASLAIAAGWKSWALVVPEDIRGKMNMAELVESYFALGVRVAVIIDPVAALEWLVSV